MTTAREYDSVRTTTDIVSDDGRTIPAGIRGAVLDAKPDGDLPGRVRLRAADR
jgi:hypothetical protein